ncbi:MAG: transporter [Acidimicrobiales bacterium]|nr:transporter [Acidimicrobiales bacterium]
MIRFAWLQARSQILIAAAAVGAAAVALLVTGMRLSHLYDTMIGPCLANGCSDTTINAFLGKGHTLSIWAGVFSAVMPGLLGVFWGAPLVARELETGTYRLAWSQSVSRTRWMVTRIGLGLVASMVVAGLFSLMITRWAHPLDIAQANAFFTFDKRDIVPIGYAAFAFVLGVAAGVLARRTLTAIAVVVVAFTAIRIAVTNWIRPILLAPVHLTAPLDPTRIGFGMIDGGPPSLFPDAPRLTNAWIYSTRIVDAAGRALTTATLDAACPTLATDLPPPRPGPGTTKTEVAVAVKSSIEGCIDKLSANFHTVTTYQPANRYWPLQWIELALYLGSALVLAAAATWWVRHRLD